VRVSSTGKRARPQPEQRFQPVREVDERSRANWSFGGSKRGPRAGDFSRGEGAVRPTTEVRGRGVSDRTRPAAELPGSGHLQTLAHGFMQTFEPIRNHPVANTAMVRPYRNGFAIAPPNRLEQTTFGI
jgi:hypothetical protein